jgi:hypothetical protein
MALSPTVTVRIAADLLGFQTALNKVAATAQSGAAKIAGGFHSMLGVINQTGVLAPFSQALGGVDAALSNMEEHGKKSFGAVAAAAGAGIAAIGTALSLMGSKEQASHQQLQTAVEATGANYDDFSGQIDSTTKHMEKFGDTSAETQDAIRILTQTTGNTQTAINGVGIAADLAAAKHESLTTAASQLAKVYGGAKGVLTQFGITAAKAGDNTKDMAAATKAAQTADQNAQTAKQHLADIEAVDAGKKHLTTAEAINLRNAQQKVTDTAKIATDAHKKLADMHATVTTKAQVTQSAIQQLATKLSGQASAASDTFKGKLEDAKAHLEDMASKMGQKWGPAIQTFGAVMVVAGSIGFAAFGWIALAVIAIGALVAVGIILYKNWDTIAAFLKRDWPLVIGIMTGGLTLFAALIWKFFGKDIKQWVSDAVDFIVNTWNGLVNSIKGIVAAISYWVSVPWKAAQDAAGAVTRAIINAWNGVVGFFVGLAGSIEYWIKLPWTAALTASDAVVKGVKDGWNGLVSFFTGIYHTFAWIFGNIGGAISGGINAGLNAIKGLWNATVGRVSFSVPSWVPVFGGDKWAFPQMAEGGIVTSPTLAMIGERGPEAVVPLGRGGGVGGPAVVIQQANFATELDVESFLRRAAWTVQTQRM